MQKVPLDSLDYAPTPFEAEPVCPNEIELTGKGLVARMRSLLLRQLEKRFEPDGAGSQADKEPTLSAEIAEREPRDAHDAYGGWVFATNAAERIHYRAPQMRRIMQMVGMVFEYDADGAVTEALAPDEQRLRACIAANGLQVVLTPRNRGKSIPGPVYAAIVESGNHPVGTANAFFYIHDVGYDHMPAPIVCGAPLFGLVRNRTAGNIMHAYDKSSSMISTALRSLFDGNMVRFAQLVDEGVPKLLHGRGKQQRQQAGGQLRQMISDGLDRLGIAHPDITA